MGVDYLIVGIIALAAAFYLFRHFRAKLRPPDGASGCPGCGGTQKSEPAYHEQPFPIIKKTGNGNKTE